MEGKRGATQGEWGEGPNWFNSGSVTAYPRGRGRKQHEWEPPRVSMEYSHNNRGKPSNSEETATKTETAQRIIKRPRSIQITEQIKPQMGRDIDGPAHRVGEAYLFNSCDNRTDELKALGNGVVPDTAERAFRVLWDRF